MFRGYSVFMRGKDPRDAHFITSRICGICGDNHTTCSIYAQNMAYGIKTPKLAELIINLGEAAEYMFDHSIFQDNLVFVDFCERMVKETNPSAAGPRPRRPRRRTPRSTAIRTIADIMRSFNPFSGAIYREALQMSRLTREMFCLMEGRHVHPSTLYPGGVGHGADAAAVHRLPGAADEVHRLRQEDRAAQRRRLRLLLRGAAGLRAGRQPAHPARLLGRVPEPRRRRLHLQEHDRLGPRDVRDARASSSTASCSPPTSSRSTSASASCSATRTTTTGRARRRSSPTIRSATRSTSATPGTRRRSRSRRSAISRTAPYSWVMSPRWHDKRSGKQLPLDTGGGPLARLWTTALANMVDQRYVKADRQERGDHAAQDRELGRGAARVEDPEVGQHHRARSRARLLHRLRGGDGAWTSSSRRWRGCAAATCRSSRTSTCPRRRSAAASTRRCAACCRITW